MSPLLGGPRCAIAGASPVGGIMITSEMFDASQGERGELSKVNVTYSKMPLRAASICKIATGSPSGLTDRHCVPRPIQHARSNNRMPGRLAAVLKRFASRGVQIQREILRDPEFRAVCEDYGDAVEALDRWSNSSDSAASTRKSEYFSLVQELELEISDRLETLPDS